MYHKLHEAIIHVPGTIRLSLIKSINDSSKISPVSLELLRRHLCHLRGAGRGHAHRLLPHRRLELRGRRHARRHHRGSGACKQINILRDAELVRRLSRRYSASRFPQILKFSRKLIVYYQQLMLYHLLLSLTSSSVVYELSKFSSFQGS